MHLRTPALKSPELKGKRAPERAAFTARSTTRSSAVAAWLVLNGLSYKTHSEAIFRSDFFLKTYKRRLSKQSQVAWFFLTESQLLLCLIRRKRWNLWVSAFDIWEISKPDGTPGAAAASDTTLTVGLALISASNPRPRPCRRKPDSI